MRHPTDLSPLPQHLGSGLPTDVLYQPDVIGGSLGINAGRGKGGDFWDALTDEAGDASPIAAAGANTRQRLNDFSVVARTTSRQALQGNDERTYLAIQNRGAASVFIAFGKPATDNSFEIPPGPGFYEPILGTTTSVHVIAAAGEQPVTIVEGYRQS